MAKRARIAVLPADQVASRGAVAVDGDVDEGAERGPLPGRPRGLDRPAQPLGLGADGEIDLIRVASADLDRPGAARGDRERDLG